MLQVSGYFRGSSESKEGGNKYMTERNAERLADALCRMRGAALKLGQLISIQDENVLPPQVLFPSPSFALFVSSFLSFPIPSLLSQDMSDHTFAATLF